MPCSLWHRRSRTELCHQFHRNHHSILDLQRVSHVAIHQRTTHAVIHTGAPDIARKESLVFTIKPALSTRRCAGLVRTIFTIAVVIVNLIIPNKLIRVQALPHGLLVHLERLVQVDISQSE